MSDTGSPEPLIIVSFAYLNAPKRWKEVTIQIVCAGKTCLNSCMHSKKIIIFQSSITNMMPFIRKWWLIHFRTLSYDMSVLDLTANINQWEKVLYINCIRISIPVNIFSTDQSDETTKSWGMKNRAHTDSCCLIG